ncbi:MAG TPA: VWA domain-containing protein, partial [Actinomycetota bacterium]|nr:VWA domain-containing protein [Actinomycetota bacterium]
MSFLSGWRLVFLVVPVALLAAYVVAQRARQRAALRFTSVDMLASVAPRRPGWQRHLPAIALLAALAVLIVGFAQPARAIRIPRGRATVILVLDVSGSMVANDVAPTRLAAAQQGARDFVNALPLGVQIGLEAFSSSAQMLVAPTSDRSSLVAAINGLSAGGGTATAAAINLALSAISALPPAANGKKAPAAIVLASDGAPTIGVNGQDPITSAEDSAQAAKQAGVPIHTIAYGTESGTVTVEGQVIPVPADPATMAQIASLSGGQTFSAQSAGQLQSVYTQIGRAVGYDVRKREITAWFTGIGLLL